MEKKIDFDDKNHTLLVLLKHSRVHTPHFRHQAQGMGFKAKEELHITILGYKAGKIISEHINANRELLEPRYIDAVNEFMMSTHEYLERFIHISDDDEMRIIEKQYDDGLRKSLVYMIEPGEHHLKFHHKMEALFPGIERHLPIPHITIGVDGDHNGIGLTKHVWNNELTNNFRVSHPR